MKIGVIGAGGIGQAFVASDVDPADFHAGRRFRQVTAAPVLSLAAILARDLGVTRPVPLLHIEGLGDVGRRLLPVLVRLQTQADRDAHQRAPATFVSWPV